MNILLLGNGGREHAFAWKIAQSLLCQQLYIAPGNAGTAELGINIPIDPMDFDEVADFVLDEEIDLVIVGAEAPLVEGIYDYFQADEDLKDIPIIGPSKSAAQLEGSKAFAKAFMQEFGIPTAAYREFTAANLEEGIAYIATQTPPIVLKADGLAAGKGVLIINDISEAQAELQAMLQGKFGKASERVVIEQFLNGIECSVFVLTDGKNYKILPSAKDYKRIGEGDKGLNTGGMGAISPVPFLTDDLMAKIETTIIQPTIKGIQQWNLDYKGFIFFGLIIVEGNPYVIEYNCRMGDPETQVVFPRWNNDLVEVLIALAKGQLNEIEMDINPQSAAAVILVSGGYPNDYEKGKVIEGIENVEGSLVFHAGTQELGDQIVTNGGRVIAITSLGKNFREAVRQSIENAAQIHFEGKYFRRDIGFDL